MTDLLSRADNPRGWVFSSVATVLCGVMLLPAATLFQRGWLGSYRCWTVFGGWLYRIGLITSCVLGVTSPLQQPYVPIHIWLAFLAFMTMVAGLAVLLGVAAHSSGRVSLAAFGVLQGVALLYMAYLFFTPSFFNERLWFLALCEWTVSALIVAGTVVLATGLIHNSYHRTETGGRLVNPENSRE